MVFSVRRSFYRALAYAAAALALSPARAQFFPGIPSPIPQPVIDINAQPQWVKELLLVGKEIAIAERMAEDTLTINNNIRYQISGFRNKSWWRMTLPPAVTIRVHDTNGEVVDWNITTGGGYTQPGQVWTNSALRLSPGELQAAANPGAVRPESLASAEIVSALGAQGLATIQQSQRFLNQNMPAMNNLRATILDPSPATNSFTNQLQEVAAASSQNLSINAQVLQGQSASLGILTGVAKVLADALTSDTQTQIQANMTRQSQPTGIGGIGHSLTTHP